MTPGFVPEVEGAFRTYASMHFAFILHGSWLESGRGLHGVLAANRSALRMVFSQFPSNLENALG